jgi:sarcosine oxidase delta subunit
VQLPQATLAQWGGYIFVRDNPEGPGIEELNERMMDIKRALQCP